MNKRHVLMKITFDLLCPTVQELAHLEYMFKRSEAIVRHDVVLQSVHSPSKLTYSKEDTIKLLQSLKKDDWKEWLSKSTPPLYLK